MKSEVKYGTNVTTSAPMTEPEMVPRPPMTAPVSRAIAVVKPPVSGAAIRTTKTSIDPPTAPYAALIANAPTFHPAGQTPLDRRADLAVAERDDRTTGTALHHVRREEEHDRPDGAEHEELPGLVRQVARASSSGSSR